MQGLPFERIVREPLVCRKATTDPKFGSDPAERSTEELLDYGVVNIDKPSGPTSHQVSAYVQKILGKDKAGHSGTLDPKVTGVLPTALGRGTRIVQSLLTAGKEYLCLMHLHKTVPEEQIREVCASFVGKIKQLPPIKSSVKRQWRFRKIYYLEILEIDGQDVLFRVGCQAGTYIRKLCLHPETQIIASTGLLRASDFYNAPAPVYSLHQGKLIKKKPSAVQKIPAPKQLIKITTSTGVDFTVTPDHELLASTKEGYQMIEAKTLRRGDYLVKSLHYPRSQGTLVVADLLDDQFYVQQPEIKQACKKALIAKYGSIRGMYRALKLDRKAFLAKSDSAITIRHLKLSGIYELVKKKLHTFKTQEGSLIAMKTLSKDLFYLLGLIASDGNNTREKNTVRHTRIKFHNKEQVLIDLFVQKYQKLFPTFPLSKKKIRNTLWEIDVTNSFLATIASSLGIKSPQKHADLFPLLQLSPSSLRAFLKGYFDGDGSAYYKKKAKGKSCYTRICYHTISKVDANRLHKVLLKVGIPNTIFTKKVSSNYSSNKANSAHLSSEVYLISVGTLGAQHAFIENIGSNHPLKLATFEKIRAIAKHPPSPYDHYLIGFHFKEFVRCNKNRLHGMGGNLTRVLKANVPFTRGFYQKASQKTKLPPLDDFIIEKITGVEHVKGAGYVYDMTVPTTHNFLIETGFVSSNCHDIGEQLTCGAHMAELRRTKAGPFKEDTLCTLQDLEDAMWYYQNENNDAFLRALIQPIEAGVAHLPKVWILDSTVNAICHGINLAAPGIAKVDSEIQVDEMVAIMTLKNELVATGTIKMISKEITKAEKGIVVTTDKVFMKPGLYPKIDKSLTTQ